MKSIFNFKEFIGEYVTPDIAKFLNYKTNLPLDNDIFMNAVENTSGVELTDVGLVVKSIRYQKDEQDGEVSLRTGVFYLPSGDKNISFYKGAKYGYGGNIKHENLILIKNPIFIKGATGGKAPENAYDLLKGRGKYNEMRTAVVSKLNIQRRQPEDIAQILTDYNEDTDYNDNYDIAHMIVNNSKVGNTLIYAIMENIIAHAVRDAGYDSVLGYSKRRDGSYFISEIFDVRELTYPSKHHEPTIHSRYTNEDK